jgi:molybdopterin-guanine dinucleotide biosynthesis protein A
MNDDVTGIVLCGGSGRRFQGTDKPLLEFQGQPMVATVSATLQQLARTIVISANRNIDRYSVYAPVIEDDPPAGQGPLAGIAACLAQCPTPYAIVCPGDSPGVSAEVFERLIAAIRRDAIDAACAHDGERRQNLHLALRCDIHDNLVQHLAAGKRSVHGWLATIRTSDVDCRDLAGSLFDIDSHCDLQEKNRQS